MEQDILSRWLSARDKILVWTSFHVNNWKCFSFVSCMLLILQFACVQQFAEAKFKRVGDAYRTLRELL
jgi:hypothetical protein